MKAPFYNKLNSIVLIAMGVWGYLDYTDVHSPTALIPVGFGVMLLLCTNGLKKENKIISHVAVLLTLLILVALAGMRYCRKVLIAGGLGIGSCVSAMIVTSVLSMVAFIISFINARK